MSYLKFDVIYRRRDHRMATLNTCSDLNVQCNSQILYQTNMLGMHHKINIPLQVFHHVNLINMITIKENWTLDY